MTRPLVSICVPTYNRAALLRESLTTICAQTYAPLEILLSDNGSTDETPALCRELQARDPRVRYVRHAHNIGLYQNHNFCVQESRGELLGLFHDDDLYEPTIVEEYVTFLQRHPDVGLVCSDWELIDDDRRPVGTRRFRGRSIRSGAAYVAQTIRSGRSSLNCPGTMIRRASLGSVRFDEEGPIGFGDFVVWFQVAERAAVGHIPRRLWKYRIHRGSLSRRTIVAMAQDYRIALGRYCRDHLARWSSHGALVARLEVAIDRFLFWALVYEIGRHYRLQQGGEGPTQTIFDMMGYTLTPQEVQEAISLLKQHERGLFKPLVRRTVERFVRTGHVRSLGWISTWAPRLREALNR